MPSAEQGLDSKTYIGLYYPQIHFQSDAWLKLAALYWDRMGRIVPAGYRPKDTDTVQRLSGETDFIMNVRPSGEVAQVSEVFRRFVNWHFSDLQDRYALSNREGWPAVTDFQAAGLASDKLDPRLFYIYYDFHDGEGKIHPGLLQALTAKGLAEELPIKSRDLGAGVSWIGMHPKLASVYMTALANEMAARRAYRPLSEDFTTHLTSGCTMERLAQALLGDTNIASRQPLADEVPAHMAMIAFEAVIPKDIETVDPKKIVKFRTRHAAERAAFQSALDNFVLELKEWDEVSDADAVSAHLTAGFEKSIKPTVSELKKVLHSLEIDCLTGVLNIHSDMPKLLTTAGGVLGASLLGHPILGVGAVAFSILPVYREKRKQIKDAAAQAPIASYLLNLETEVAPQSRLAALRTRAEQFVFPL